MNAVLASTMVPETVPSHPAAGRWLEVVSHLEPRYGGLSAAVPALADALSHQGIRVSLAGFCAPGEEFQPAEIDPEQLSFWPAGRKAWLKSELRGAFRSRVSQSDGVHIHGLWEQSTAMAGHTARSLRIPYVLSAHGMLEPWALGQRRLKKLLYASAIERRNVAEATCLHALTAAEAEQYIRFGARGPIAVIPNGVNIPRVLTPAPFLESFPALRGRRIVLFLARLHPKKGLDLLLDAWAAVAPESRDACLVLAGPDSEGTRARLEAEIARSGIGSSVLFAGMLDARMKWSALAVAEAFVLPSYSEGLSVGILEAMGAGLPVIVTDACNMPEVREAGAGWQIQPDCEQLAAALRELLSNSSAANARIGEHGAQLIRRRYSWSEVSGQMARLYGWLQGGERPCDLNLVYP